MADWSPRSNRSPYKTYRWIWRSHNVVSPGEKQGARINRSTSSRRTVNSNHAFDYNTSGSSTVFFRFGRTHITPG